ncbi:MAG: hypothetical protein ACR2MP_27610 [Streptosporangiaceae bacterium]
MIRAKNVTGRSSAQSKALEGQQRAADLIPNGLKKLSTALTLHAIKGNGSLNPLRSTPASADR